MLPRVGGRAASSRPRTGGRSSPSLPVGGSATALSRRRGGRAPPPARGPRARGTRSRGRRRGETSITCRPTANAIACGKSIGIGLHEHLGDRGLEEPDVARPEREQLDERRDEEDEPCHADRRVDVGRLRARRRCRRSARPRRRARRPARHAAVRGPAQHGLAALHAARDRDGASRAPAARARTRGRGARARRLRRENISSPMTASSTTMTTPPKARIMCSKRAGTFTNGSCSAMITTSAIASTICSATTEPASVAVGTSVPTSLQPALQHRDAPDLADARRQQRVEQEADEERRHDVRVEEARLARDRVERDLPDDGLEQDREQVERRATRSPTTRRRRPSLTVLMLTERSASSSSTPKSARPATMRQGAVRLAGARIASSETVTSS